MSMDHCRDCTYFIPEKEEYRSREDYEPWEPPMCQAPVLMEVQQEAPATALAVEHLFFTVSDKLSYCPMKVRKIARKRRKLQGPFRALDY